MALHGLSFRRLIFCNITILRTLYIDLYQKIQPIRMQEKCCIFVGIPPNLPMISAIQWYHTQSSQSTWQLPLYETVMQCLLVIYHGISHLSLAFSWHAHSPKRPCVYKGNTTDSWDIPQYITWKHCITSIYTLFKGGTYPRMPCYLPSKCLWILFLNNLYYSKNTNVFSWFGYPVV